LTEAPEPLANAYDERRQRDHAKLEQMIVYAQSELESAAVHQWEAIEQRRRSLVPSAFATSRSSSED
jgi:hypothetical protein